MRIIGEVKRANAGDCTNKTQYGFVYIIICSFFVS